MSASGFSEGRPQYAGAPLPKETRCNVSPCGPLRTGSRTVTETEVDHLAPVNIYESLAKAAAGDDAIPLSQLCAPMNSMGNCSLLEKTFNISKSDRALAAFLEDVHEFKSGEVSLAEWTRSMNVTAPLLRPKSTSLNEVQDAIQLREKAIKKDLAEFIQGTKPRVGVT